MSAIRQAERRKLIAVAGIVLIFAGMACFAIAATSAQPAEDPLVNESVNVTDHANESVYVDIAFVENASVDVWAYDETGAEIANATVTGDAGATESHEFAISSDGTYTVEVYANSSDLEDVWVSTAPPDTNESGLLAGGGGGSDLDLPVPGWVVAVFLLLFFTVMGVVARIES